MNITCHCWLNENHILLGLDTGSLCIVNKYGDVVEQFHALVYLLIFFSKKTIC